MTLRTSGATAETPLDDAAGTGSDTAPRGLRRLIDMVRTANVKGEPELRMSVRIATLIAVLVAANATLHQQVGAPSMATAIPVGLVVAFWFSYVSRFRPGFAVKLLLAAGMLVAVIHFIGQLAGIGSNAAAAQRPLAELFLWTQLLHSFDVPARRDLRFSLTASTVLIGVGGVLSISSDFAISLALWAIASTVALCLMHTSQLAELPGVQPSPATTSHGRSVGRRVTHRRLSVPWMTLGAVCGVALVAASIFLVLPASGTARAFTFPSSLPHVDRIPGGGLVNPSLGGGSGGGGSSNGGESSGGDTPRASFGFVGFSTEMDTAARGRPDDTIVMKVRADKPGFWRGQSFDTWDGRRWKPSTTKTRVANGDGVIDLPEFEGTVPESQGEEFIQTVYVEKPGPNLVFAASTATKLYFPDRSVLVLPDGTVRAGVSLSTGAVYTVVSRRPVADPALMAIPYRRSTASVGLGAPGQNVYTQVPAELPTRVADLAASVTASELTLLGKVEALQNWMATNTTYAIDIPTLPPGADAVDTFLFDQRVGFCEQIASSLVMMLRTLGVPARLGVGYAAGERNPFTGLYEVKASDAHAWAEVYFPNVGWLTFDPTADVPFADDAAVPLARSGLADFLSRTLAPAIGVAGQLAVGAGALAGLLGTVWFTVRHGRRRVARRRRTWAAVWNDRFDRAAAKAGHPRQPGQTARTLADELGWHGEDWDVALATLDRFSFSPDDISPQERERADLVLALLPPQQDRPLRSSQSHPFRESRADLGASMPSSAVENSGSSGAWK